MEKLTPSLEDYLKEIYLQHKPDTTEIVHASDVAHRMGLRKTSVCRATDVLAQKGLLKKEKFVGFFLTDMGCARAEFLIRRYESILAFLTEILWIDSDIARNDAHGIEHVISQQCYEAICFHIDNQSGASHRG
jgi:DtxR family Mn-dependent transcriptional regulator